MKAAARHWRAEDRLESVALFLGQLHFASAWWWVAKWVRDSVRRKCVRHPPGCPQSTTSMLTLVLTLTNGRQRVSTRVSTFKCL